MNTKTGGVAILTTPPVFTSIYILFVTPIAVQQTRYTTHGIELVHDGFPYQSRALFQ